MTNDELAEFIWESADWAGNIKISFHREFPAEEQSMMDQVAGMLMSPGGKVKRGVVPGFLPVPPLPIPEIRKEETTHNAYDTWC